MKSFARLNPGIRHVVFDRSRAQEFIAEHFSAREVEAFRACAMPTSQADYLRYCAAFVMGGLGIDADVRCVGRLDSLFSRSERGTVFGQRDPSPPRIARLAGWSRRIGPYETLINGIFVFARTGDPLLKLAIEYATANIESRVAEGPAGVWLTTGPGIFTSVYLLRELGSVDAYLRHVANTVLEPAAEVFCALIDGRADRILDGLDMLAVEDVGAWVRHVGVPRSSPGVVHWSRPEGSIFR